MNINDLRMGDLLKEKGTLSSTLLLIAEVNDGVTKKIVVIWDTACYVFDSTEKEAIAEQKYINAINNDEYTLVGNLCDIHGNLI